MDTSIVSKENAKQQIKELIEKYNKVVEEQRVSKYNEEMTKKDFILPLFRALGWDVENSNEVSAEEKISKKRVDYGFRINGIPKFFLEAKPLKADLNSEEYAVQAINYAWHKGCTWAVLTDFEEVKVFNAELKTEFPLQNVFFSLNYEKFLENFEQLWLLSRGSFEQGLLDKEAEKWGKKLKKTSVDKQLLMDFTKFRELLSKNIMKLNQGKNLTEEELDEAVQRILDRLIFIRNCEDRELESKILISKLRDWESKGRGLLIKYLQESFEYFDEQYNSKLFQNHLCDSLEIDSEVLSEIINGLYYTKEGHVSYDFSAIEADVLGNIYEQYLGHVLKKTEKRAKVTENHVHRKEQGIYYTPTYIVDYIVRNTLGELLKDKKVDAEKIRVLDPACGSGSFLIKAFDVLSEYYSKKGESEQTKFDTTGTSVTFTKKVEILKNNIFGVDLDSKAVEIAQLNLLLKIAEKSQRLPLLQENIKCGNSLIDDEKVVGDKAFKWKQEFKQIMDDGGFNVVVGNPPYGAELPSKEKIFFRENYVSGKLEMDSFALFVERALVLLREGGFFGFIIPNTLLTLDKFADLRRLLLENTHIYEIVDLGPSVFEDSTVSTILLFVRKIKPSTHAKILVKRDIGDQAPIVIIQKNWSPKSKILLEVDESRNGLIARLKTRKTVLFKEILDAKKGITTGNNEKYLITPNGGVGKFAEYKAANLDKIREIIRGEEVGRYWLRKQGWQMVYDPKSISKEPNGRPRTTYYLLFENEKILSRDVVGEKDKKLILTLDESGVYPLDTAYIIVKRNSSQLSYKYFLGVLNSKLINKVFSWQNKGIHVKASYFDDLPIRTIDFSNDKEKKLHDELVELVDKMLSLNKRLDEIGDKKTDERARIEEEIKKTDAEIDELVYKIYGITKEEKKIIEESLK